MKCVTQIRMSDPSSAYFLSQYYHGALGIAVVKTQSIMFEGPSRVFEQSGEVPGGLKIYLSKNREKFKLSSITAPLIFPRCEKIKQLQNTFLFFE